MKVGWLAIAAFLYCVNLVCLFFWPSYANAWADWGTQITSNSVYPWMWASVGEFLRFLFIIGFATVIYLLWCWLWPEAGSNVVSSPQPAANRFIQATAATFALGNGAYDDTLHALDGMMSRSRVQMIKSRDATLPYGLTVDQVSDLIGPLMSRDKVEAIHILAPHLAPGSPTSQLLNGLMGNDRIEADKYLHS